MMTTTMTQRQDQLDELSRLLSSLDTDELCATVVNSRIERGTTPMLAIISLMNLISTLTSLVENEEDKNRVAAGLHDLADLIGNRERGLLN